jgi:hypothetical protein
MNLDDTKIFVYDDNGNATGHWRIIDLNGGDVVDGAHMPQASANHGWEPYWDRTQQNVFWMPVGNVLQKCIITAVNSVSCANNHTFSEYTYGINSMDETDMTPNGWLFLVGQNTVNTGMDAFMYNPSTALKSPVYTTTCTGDVMNNQPGCIHKVIATPNDGAIIQFTSSGLGRDQGNIIWESPWNGGGNCTGTCNPAHYESIANHEDVMKDLNGNEVGVSEDYQDNTALCGFQPAVITVPNTPQNCPLTPNTATNPGWHVSTRDWPARPWIVYTRQGESAAERFNNDGSYADPTSGNWDTFTNEIILVRVDANQDSSKVYRLTLTHTRNVNSGDAWADATASISWDGKYVVFDSNAAWNATGCGAIASCSDVYLIQIH